jgi:hypothetical protein
MSFEDPIGMEVSMVRSPEGRVIDVTLQLQFTEKDWPDTEALDGGQVMLMCYAQMYHLMRMSGMGRSKFKAVHRQLEDLMRVEIDHAREVQRLQQIQSDDAGKVRVQELLGGVVEQGAGDVAVRSDDDDAPSGAGAVD